MSSPKKDWVKYLKNKTITEEILSVSLYSANKRAKNCRDKIHEYRHCGYYSQKLDKSIERYQAQMEKYYNMKDIMLSLLLPVGVHTNYFDNGEEELLLYYKTAYGSYHQPIREEDIKNVKFKGSVPEKKTLDSFKTHGADINDLVSAQFVNKVCELIKTDDFSYVTVA